MVLRHRDDTRHQQDPKRRWQIIWRIRSSGSARERIVCLCKMSGMKRRSSDSRVGCMQKSIESDGMLHRSFVAKNAAQDDKPNMRRDGDGPIQR